MCTSFPLPGPPSPHFTRHDVFFFASFRLIFIITFIFISLRFASFRFVFFFLGSGGGGGWVRGNERAEDGRE